MKTLLAMVVVALVPSAVLADERETLNEVEKSLQSGQSQAAELAAQAAKAGERLDTLRQQMIALAKSAQTDERELSEIESTLDALNAEEAATQAGLQKRQEQINAAMMALQRLGLHPPDSLVAVRASPTETVRTALMLRAAVPMLRDSVSELAAGLETLAEVRGEIAANRKQYEVRVAALDSQRAELRDVIEEANQLRVELLHESEVLAKRNAALAAKAKSLRDLIDKLARATTPPTVPRMKPARLMPPRLRSFAAARGTIEMPAQGAVAQRYGQAMTYGGTSRGIAIETRPEAQVVAPFDGQILFAGPFRGYGQILIIEHSDGYHTLLAGLDRVQGVVGQWVLAGEPIGTMGRPAGQKPRLYVEIRQGGQAVNPSPWLASLKSKDNG